MNSNLRYPALVFLLFFAIGATPKDPPRAVVVVGPSGPVSISTSTRAVLVAKARRLIESSNFNSLRQPEILPVPTQKEWDQLCLTPCVEITFSNPERFQTIGGPVVLAGVRISLVQGNVQGIIDGKFLRFGKYDGVTWIEVRNATGIKFP